MYVYMYVYIYVCIYIYIYIFTFFCFSIHYMFDSLVAYIGYHFVISLETGKNK